MSLRIASMTAAQFAYAWDAPTGKLLSPDMDHAAAIRSIAFPKLGKDKQKVAYQAFLKLPGGSVKNTVSAAGKAVHIH